MTNKEFILDSLIDDDEAFTQILEYFKLAAEIKISPLELKKMLNEMVEEGYIFINYAWKTERDEYPYSLTEKGNPKLCQATYGAVQISAYCGIS